MSDDTERTPRLVRFAWILTALMLAGAVAAGLLFWPSFRSMAPNEWGDFLSGLAASLAFLWLIVGYWLHSSPGRLSTSAMGTSRVRSHSRTSGASVITSPRTDRAQLCAYHVEFLRSHDGFRRAGPHEMRPPPPAKTYPTPPSKGGS